MLFALRSTNLSRKQGFRGWRFRVGVSLLRLQLHGAIDSRKKLFYVERGRQRKLIALFRCCDQHLCPVSICLRLLINPWQQYRMGGRRLNHLFETRSVSKISKNDVESSCLEGTSKFFFACDPAETVPSLSHDRLKPREFDILRTRRVGIHVKQNRGRIIRCVDQKSNAPAYYQQLVTTGAGRRRIQREDDEGEHEYQNDFSHSQPRKH